jgi:hypothetical protein
VLANSKVVLVVGSLCEGGSSFPVVMEHSKALHIDSREVMFCTRKGFAVNATRCCCGSCWSWCT